MKTFQKKRSLIEVFFLILKGIMMGAANKVPGVSGGIVALVGGFYEELIYSFQRLNFVALKLFFTGRIKVFWNYTNAHFLFTLFALVTYLFTLLHFSWRGNRGGINLKIVACNKQQVEQLAQNCKIYKIFLDLSGFASSLNPLFGYS